MMAGFDPDAYLAQKGFDPDEYLKLPTQRAPNTITREEYLAAVEKNKPSVVRQVTKQLGNLAAGAYSGAGSFGATILRPFESVEENQQRRRSMDDAFRQLGNDPDSFAYGAGKLAAEVAGTLPVGGILGKGVQTVAQGTKFAPTVAPVVTALRTGGMNAGGVTGAKGLALRAGAGAAVGGASTAMISPEDAGTGAVIGGALPVLGKGVAEGSQAVGRYFRPAEVKVAEKLTKTTGLSKKQILDALNQPGPQLIPGYQKTVPQILQDDTLSQLQRTLKTAGVNNLGEAERLQQAQFLEALNRVAPVRTDVVEAAQRAGGAIESYAIPARSEVSKQVRAAFDAVDPFTETKLFLPLHEMKKASTEYLGPGTFGTGARAVDALKTAGKVGTETLEAVKPITQKTAGKSQSLEQAVRAAGGIRGSSGELRDLGIKQSGTTGLVNNKTGKAADLLAEDMYQRGFLPDNDPATLFDMLRNGQGRKVFASDVSDDGYRRSLEMAMGDAPEATVIPKAVPFNVVQNLRSSVGEAAEQAAAKGANKEAAALRQMVDEIDSSINRAAGSGALPGEYFPKDIADQYRLALDLHKKKMLQFETGPQMSMFRKGGDGQASIQGAEIPGKFYSGAMSQADDVKAFKRLIANRGDLERELKSFAMTQGASTADAQGNLGNKFITWLAGRSGANKELFTPSELATINEVGKAVQNQIRTEGLGRVSGSDTTQKLFSLQSNGILDSRVADILATKIPVIGSFTGPALQGLRNTAAQTRNQTIAQLLADPQAFRKALENPETSSALINALRYSAPTFTRITPAIAAD